MKIRLESPLEVNKGDTLEIEVMPDQSVKVTVIYDENLGVSTFVPAQITLPQE